MSWRLKRVPADEVLVAIIRGRNHGGVGNEGFASGAITKNIVNTTNVCFRLLCPHECTSVI